MEYRCFVVGNLMTNCYLLWSGCEAGVIDPGGPVDEVVGFMNAQNLKLNWIVNTHGHADHIEGNGELKKRYGAPLFIHQADRPMLTSDVVNFSAFLGQSIVSPDADRELRDGDRIQLGAAMLEVIETPGHTPGGISLYTPGLLFSGDTLFCESIGRTDFPGGSYNLLIKVIKERLLKLPPQTKVLPGHAEPTSIEHELNFNPFVGS